MFPSEPSEEQRARLAGRANGPTLDLAGVSAAPGTIRVVRALRSIPDGGATVVADPGRLPFADATFQVALLVHGAAPVAEVARTVRRGGRLSIAAPFGGDVAGAAYPGDLIAAVKDAAGPEALEVDAAGILLDTVVGEAGDAEAALVRAQPAIERVLVERQQTLLAARAAVVSARDGRGTTDGLLTLQERTRALHDEAAALRRRVAGAEQQVAAVRASKWWQLGALLRELARSPWRAPLLVARLAKLALAMFHRTPHVKRGEALFAQKRYDEAAVEYDRALERNPSDVRALKSKREALSKMGDLTGMLAVVRQMRAIFDNDVLERHERALVGRLRELDTAWLPEVAGGANLEPASPGRVLHILKHSLPYHVNGYTVRSRYTLLSQAGAGLEPFVVTSPGFPREDGVERFDPVEDVDGIPHHRLDVGGGFPLKSVPHDEQVSLFTWLAADVVREVRPALIHARSGFRGYENALVGLALGGRFGLPVVYEVSSFLESTWTADVEWSEKGELYKLRYEQENRCMREAAQVITIAESMRDDIVSRGIAPERVTVIPNAVDPAAFEPKDPDPELVRSLGLDGKVVVGYISNLGYREGIDVLVRAAANLIARGLPVACLVVGDGPERPGLEKLIAELGVAGEVILTGQVPHDRIRDYYALIDVFVIPRRDDRAARLVTPLKPYEAMAMGKPLVVSSLPALVEIVGKDERGLTFQEGSHEACAARLERLVSDRDARRALGDRARTWVTTERTWDANGRRYRDLYASVLDRFGTGTRRA